MLSNESLISLIRLKTFHVFSIKLLFIYNVYGNSTTLFLLRVVLKDIELYSVRLHDIIVIHI